MLFQKTSAISSSRWCNHSFNVLFFYKFFSVFFILFHLLLAIKQAGWLSFLSEYKVWSCWNVHFRRTDGSENQWNQYWGTERTTVQFVIHLIYYKSYTSQTILFYYAPAHRAEALSDDERLTLSDVCLSRKSGLSWEQRGLGRLKLAQK